MTRKEQVLAAAEKWMHTPLKENSRLLAQYIAFESGADWADKNPEFKGDSTKLLNSMHSRLKSALSERDALKAKLAEAIDVLEIVHQRIEQQPYKDEPRVTATSVQIAYVLHDLRRYVKATGEAPVALGEEC